MGRFILAVVTAIAVTQVSNLITTVWLHRSLAHKSLTFDRRLSFAFRWVIWLSTGMKPREWVAVHRKHHAHTDTPDDPHSPKVEGWGRVQFLNAAMYRRHARDGVTVNKYAKDLPADRWDKLVFDHALVGLGLGIAMLIVMFGPVCGLVASVIHAVFYLSISGAVNGIGHTFGRRPDETSSATNSQWLAWLSGGEGLHNNHHAKPTSATLALRKGEVDPGWWFIRLAKKLHLARLRHDNVTSPALAA
jgi:stearoyl-CoA desaturase (Delta-9 desaturase)